MSVHAKTLLRALPHQLISLKPHVSMKMKTIPFSRIFWNGSTRLIKAFNPMQGSDIIFIALLLRLLRPVIETISMRVTDLSHWVVWGWDIYNAIILSFGIALYFLRRLLQLRHQ